MSAAAGWIIAVVVLVLGLVAYCCIGAWNLTKMQKRQKKFLEGRGGRAERKNAELIKLLQEMERKSGIKVFHPTGTLNSAQIRNEINRLMEAHDAQAKKEYEDAQRLAETQRRLQQGSGAFSSTQPLGSVMATTTPHSYHQQPAMYSHVAQQVADERYIGTPLMLNPQSGSQGWGALGAHLEQYPGTADAIWSQLGNSFAQAGVT